MSNTSDTSPDAGVPSGKTKPEVSDRKTIKWLACIFFLIIGVLVMGSTLISSHGNISPCFAKAGNCQEYKAGTPIHGLLPGEEESFFLVELTDFDDQLSDIHCLFSDSVYPALEQLLQSESIYRDRSEDFFCALDKAKTTLSIDTERKTSEMEKIASSLEETIQSSSDPKEWW